MTIEVSQDLEEILQRELQSGDYHSQEELLRDALSALQNEREHYENFRKNLHDRLGGLHKGNTIGLENDEAMGKFLDDIDDEVNQEFEAQDRQSE